MTDQIIIEEKKLALGKDVCFSILIPSWNNLPYLRLCIESIKKNSMYHHQVIVHVNEGVDGTFEWINKQPDIDYTFSKKNIGVCYALNAARGLVVSDYIVYMNDDMYTCPGWDKELVEEIRKTGHHNFFFSATAIEPDASNNCVIERNFGTSPETFREEELLAVYADLKMNDWQGSTWPPNVVHKNVWDLVGGYSTEFSPGMYSDPDFSMKLWQAGIRLFKGVSSSRVYHFGSKSTKRVRKNKGYYTFIAKWKMTSGTFTNYFLRRGQPFNGELTEPSVSGYIKIKNFFKRWVAVFTKY